MIKDRCLVLFLCQYLWYAFSLVSNIQMLQAIDYFITRSKLGKINDCRSHDIAENV